MVKFEILSESDKKLVHEKSLEILEKAGIRIESEKILGMMKDAGCDVDSESSTIKFPREYIEKCIRQSPAKFVLGGFTEENDMMMGEGNSYIATDGQGCFATDLETGERKDSTMEDLRNIAKISDELDYIKCFWPSVTAGDVADETRTVREMVECWKVSSKHFQTDCFNEEQGRLFEKVLIKIFGSRERVIERHPLTLCCCPVTPLVFEASMVEGTVHLGDLSVPVLVLPMPISGTTSPMSLLATIIQNNAEVLAGNAIFQTAHPGRPFIYGAAPGILDMSTGLFCVGSPEGALQNAACVQMANMYEMPTLVSGGGSDAQVPGIQSTAERMAGILPSYMLKADIICGVGLTATAQCSFLEELIIDEDIVGFCKRIAQGVRGGEEHALTDVAIKIGQGGNFLSEKSTLAYLRNDEHYKPKVFCRDGYDKWEKSPKKDIMEYARQKARDILSKHDKQNFDEKLSKELDEILAEAENV